MHESICFLDSDQFAHLCVRSHNIYLVAAVPHYTFICDGASFLRVYFFQQNGGEMFYLIDRFDFFNSCSPPPLSKVLFIYYLLKWRLMPMLPLNSTYSRRWPQRTEAPISIPQVLD